MNRVNTEVTRVNGEVTNISSELKYMKLLLHEVVKSKIICLQFPYNHASIILILHTCNSRGCLTTQ